MARVTYRRRIRYAFDNTMSKGTIALVGWLGLISIAMVVLFTVVVAVLGLTPTNDKGEALGFGELLWLGVTRALDPASMEGDNKSSPIFLALAVALVLGGMFIVSSLIGVVAQGVDARIASLRRGRSHVIENNHTLILGWSSQIFTIVSELITANADQKRSCIVILGDKEKADMEDALREKVPHRGKTRIVCRTGNCIDPHDLEIAHPQGARSVIVLSPEGEEPDSQVLKTILALTNSPTRRAEPYHIVAEIRHSKNMEAAALVGRGEVRFLEAGDVLSRLIVQTARQPGLSIVYTELLDFEGDEIYFQAEPTLDGKSYGEALLAYEDSAVIGIFTRAGETMLNPPMSTRLAEGDKLIAISEDNGTVKVSSVAPEVQTGAIRSAEPVAVRPERTLLLGWNHRATGIINELDKYVGPGSSITVVAESSEAEAGIASRCKGLQHQEVEFRYGDSTDRHLLNEVDVPGHERVIVLSYSDQLDAQRADARTLITLLHLRDIASRSQADFSIVTEMMDDHNRELARVTRANDFIVGEKLLSLMLTQVAENPSLADVFDDLFAAEGSEIYMKPAADYVSTGQPVNFYTVVESARQRGHTALGYRIEAAAQDAVHAYGVVVNPKKSAQVTFTPEDRIVVLAES
ncbi:MAG: potassium transporter TrkA [Chloroflexota bacterium]|nr:potassium transporter TrkA [Chloroflexota bacterium]